jgi:hypothetical protein
VACPFFMPTEKLQGGGWLHTSRLPLGCGWSGHCTAPGHEGEVPSPEELQDFCNLGYAQGCVRLPSQRAWDSIRFGARILVDGAKGGSVRRIQVRYICERNHRPAGHGFLQFDAHDDDARCSKPHPDARLQRMAECFLASYLEGKRNQEVTQAAAS